MNAPVDLSDGGRALWDAIVEEHDLDTQQFAQLAEACRAKDRCDRLAVLLSAGHDSKLLGDANTTANLLKQLLAALRLPDPTSGKRPQLRGTATGARVPQVPGGVSALDRARAAKAS